VPDTTKVREHYSAMELTERIKSPLATLGWPFRYERQSIPQFAVEMEKAGFSARFVQHIASVAQDYQAASSRARTTSSKRSPGSRR
jgi:hypothetical protein